MSIKRSVDTQKNENLRDFVVNLVKESGVSKTKLVQQSNVDYSLFIKWVEQNKHLTEKNLDMVQLALEVNYGYGKS